MDGNEYGEGHMEEEDAKPAAENKVKILKDYKTTSLTSLVINSIEIAMSIIKNKQSYSYKDNFEYYVEFFNCCRKEEFADVVSADVKRRLMRLHTDPNIRSILYNTPEEDYRNATLAAARTKKQDILDFWNKYIETNIK